MAPAAAENWKTCPACRAHFPDEALYCPNDGSPLVRAHDAAHAGDPAEARDAAPSNRPDPYVGRTILDHIEIGEVVGVGAMGRVYRAFQRGIDRDVAVKVLHRELSANEQLVARFLREAKVASRLQHPNVVNVLLSGQLPDGALYIVMEYLHGRSLHVALADAGDAFDLSRALHVALQLCDAVGEAHVQGIVHRDLKPENVMLVRRGQDGDFVKVLDFGIARLNWSEQSMSTATGLIFGTARYISPEGAQGDKVGPPGDVYSIATLVYEMLAGRTPFEGDQAVGLLIQQIHEPPPPLRSHARAAEVPPAIADVVMRGLAKNPAARYDGARAFGRALVEAARASGVTADDYYARSLFAAGSPPTPSSRALPSATPSSSSVPAAPASSRRDLGEMPLAGPTARWTPPAAVQEQIAQAHAARASHVDATLDDDDASTAEATRAARTEYATPAPQLSPVGSGTVKITPSPALSFANGAAKGGTLPIDAGVSAFAPSEGTPPPRATSPSSPTSPTSTSRPSFSAPEGEAPARRVSAVLVVLLCFLVGVGGALGLHRSGLLGRLGIAGLGAGASAPGLDSHLARAHDAIDHERWDEPPGDNVQELVQVALVRWPNEPRVAALRAQASDAMIRRAVALKSGGDLARASRLARIASELVPDSDTTRALAAEYAHELESQSSVAPLPTAGSAANAAGSTAHGQSAPAAAARASLETAPAKPSVGQSVQLVARLSAHAAATEAAFTVTSPGASGPPTRLVPVSEGSVYRAAFTFQEPGRYEIGFSARVDGGAVKTTRTLVVDAMRSSPDPSATPPPAGSVKWL